jgi:protein CpxP
MQTFKTTPFGFRPWRLMLATLVLAVAGGVAQTAVAASPEGPPPGMGPAPHGMHPGMHPGMRPGMQRDMHLGPEMAGGSARFLGRMLDLAKATPEQRRQIHQIMQAARQDLRAQREAGRQLRDQQHALLTQPNVDAAAVEALRQQMLAQHDQASQRMTQALVQASRVLSPEQRKLIGEHRAMLERHRAERQALESRR